LQERGFLAARALRPIRPDSWMVFGDAPLAKMTAEAFEILRDR
jgi:hypothetical protein